MDYYINLLANSSIAQLMFRLLLAALFGALIGLEREHTHKPAGLRTHILVCVGACLVMLTSEYLYKMYHALSPNMDIARLGAQVISGIGFLGAGTIIRNGNSVTGLTTAASLWAVACIGLATGIGYYLGATIATIVIFLILAYCKTMYHTSEGHTLTSTFHIKMNYSSELLDKIKDKITKSDISINNVEFKSDNNNATLVTLFLSTNENINLVNLSQNIYELDGVYEVNQISEEQ